MRAGRTVPVLTFVVAILIVWYVAAILANGPATRMALANANPPPTPIQYVLATWAQQRPIVPAPHQIVVDFFNSTFIANPTTNRSLVYHAWATLAPTLLGFAIGTLLGVLLAAAIVHVRSLDKSLMPWIIASQTVPILAIAPMIIVVLGSIGLTGVLPKAVISTYLSFFPVTVGMVKGFRSPLPIHLDLMRTYSATRWQVFWALRFPAAVPFLFISMRIAIAASLVGAIVGELPTGAPAGLGMRMLGGSYYGQTIIIWSALFAAAIVAAALVGLVGLADRLVARRMGGRT
ncbi:MAG TPA: ABC transporter permease [Devosia sp.]|nr:ABC transporter permease [Devosia sp.]